MRVERLVSRSISLIPISHCSNTWTSLSTKRRPLLQRPASLQLPSVMCLWRYAHCSTDFLGSLPWSWRLLGACLWLALIFNAVLDVIYRHVFGLQPVGSAALAVTVIMNFILRMTVPISNMLLGLTAHMEYLIAAEITLHASGCHPGLLPLAFMLQAQMFKA